MYLRTFRNFAVLLLIINISTSSVAYAQVIKTDKSINQLNNSLKYVPDELIVKYKKNVINLKSTSGLSKSQSFQDKNSLTLKDNIDNLNISVLKITNEKSVEDNISELESNPEVEYAEPNYIRSITTISSNDTYKDDLWGLDNTGQEIIGDYGDITGTLGSDINAPEAWTINEGTNQEVIVAVIDIGVSYSHNDLLANMWNGTNCKNESGATLNSCRYGYDYENNDKIPLPTSNSYTHGTHVAGIIGAVKGNSKGVIGIAPNSKIMALRFALDVASEVKSIDFAIQNGAKVINASYGGTEFSQAEYDAISRFNVAGGIFVASAGNCGDEFFWLNGCSVQNETLYPASFDLANIISVAATGQSDVLSTFSNNDATKVDVGAPGENILSTIPGNTYTYESGTSMAAPYVSGLAALIWGYNSDLTSAQVKNIILNNGDPVASLNAVTVSGKRVNAQKSLFAADILAKQQVHDDAVEGILFDQYPALARSTFQTAIDAATSTLNNVSSTSSNIAQGYTDLESANTTFLAAKNPADFSALTSLIASSQVLHDGATESANTGDYIVGSKLILQNAIDAAEAIPGNATQIVVDAGVVTLDDAVTVFLASIVPADTTAPVISRSGNSSVRVKLDSTYSDAGATATDDRDGDITGSIVTVNPVNVNVLGTYTVTYNVSDAALNPATEVTRTVTVYKPVVGGGGGGGGPSPKPDPEPVVTVIPMITPVPEVKPVDCQSGYLFSPSTGKPCGTSSTSPIIAPTVNPNPVRFLTSGAPIAFNRSLKPGMFGDDVVTLQKFLKNLYPEIGVDGSFGPNTKSGVVRFQAANGLTPDGAVGPKTLAKINSL